jgi:hypothetical protein
MNLTFRLHRIILGETMLVPRKILQSTARLEVIKPRLVKLPEPKTVRIHSVRSTRNIVEAGPNAPQLKRLIQYPYTQETVRPRAGKPWRQPLEARMAPDPFGQAVRAAFRDCERPSWPKVTRDSFGLPRRVRPSIDEWIAEGEKHE